MSPAEPMLPRLRVLDLTQGVAGGAATRILAALGCDVVKVERPSGDPARSYDTFDLPVPAGRESELFAYLGGGKRSIVLDLQTAGGQASLDCVAGAADLVVANYTPRVAAKLGVTGGRIADVNPHAVFVSIPNFASGSPYADYEADYLTLMAISGYSHHNGHADRAPVLVGQHFGLHVAGVMGALYAVAALRLERLSGHAAAVELPIVDALNWCGPAPTAQVAVHGHHIWGRKSGGPPGIVRCVDGYIGANMISMPQWTTIMRLVGREDYATHPVWSHDPNARLAAAPMWAPEIAKWVAPRTCAEVLETTQELRVPFAKVLDIPAGLALEHHRVRNFFVPQVIGGETVDVPGAPFIASGSSWVKPAPAPVPGSSDAEAVASEWGSRSSAVADPPGGRLRLPLEGVRVIELGAWWSAAACCTTLAHLGAEVIKIESPAMDAWRLTAAPFDRGTPWEWSPIFGTFNLNKKGMNLDLASARGKTIFLDLVTKADVVVENFSPRVMPNLGLDYAALRERNPRLVMTSISGYGGTGPLRDSVAFGVVFEQASCLASVTGYSDAERPMDLNSYSDGVIGQWAALATVAALEQRDRTGEGQAIDLAAFECLATFFGPAFAAYQLRGEVPHRLGCRSEGACPRNVYRCQGEDAWVAISVRDGSEWAALARAIGNAGWALDPALATLAGRKARASEIDEAIAAWAAERTHYVAQDLLQAAGVAAGAVSHPKEQADHPYFKATARFAHLARDFVGTVPYPRPAARFDGETLALSSPAPTWDQDTRTILGELAGLSDDAIDALYAEGVCAAVPRGWEQS